MLQALMSDLCPISGLFVVVSWISFVVPPDVIPGRMALLITLFLVLVNIFNSVTTNTPKAEGEQVKYKWTELTAAYHNFNPTFPDPIA